jgi:transcriptional regulator with XRE-family HTH domain
MHPLELRSQAKRLHAEGVPFGEICRRLGLSRSTVGKWLHGERSRRERVDRTTCPRCQQPPELPADPEAYAYLLGQYLGDGHLLITQRTPLLSVYCDRRYPEVIAEIAEAFVACGAHTTYHRRLKGCVGVQAYLKHWPCLFPQAGLGKKHDRPIVLADWQTEIVAAHPGKFLRGLFHSDGCRAVNRIKKNGKVYEYPRYFFSNKSADIMRLCQEALDRLGIEWRMARPDSLSVAKRDAVALLDQHVGPKR